MSVAQYLPSPHFSAVAGSIILSGGLIVGAQYITSPHTSSPQVAIAPVEQPGTDWKAQLDAIQAQAPGLPDAPSADTVSILLDAAKTSNYTDTAARSLLINLTDAQAQGLGSDIPTQEKLIAGAAGQVPPAKAKKTYAAQDLTVVIDSKDAEKFYGNKVMEILGRHTGATSDATLYAIAKATDNSDTSALSALPHIQQEYAALVEELAAVPTPATMVPLHVQILNSLAITAATFDDMKTVLLDPLRGLQGIQQYQLQLGAVGRVFTSVAQILSKNGILFNKDEPGAAWSVFISP
jgi:hypothetical protein